MDGGDDVGEAHTAGGAFSAAQSSDCLFERGSSDPLHFTWLATLKLTSHNDPQ